MTEVVNDTFLPSQAPNPHALPPEKKLWAAVLHRARLDLAGRGSLGAGRNNGRLSAPRVAIMAANWFAADTEQPGDFVWICHHLGLNPDTIRASLPEVPVSCYAAIESAPKQYRAEWGI